MIEKPRLLKLMRSSDIKLSKSDRKLAAIIQRDPHRVIHQSIASLAEQAEVSEPTVSRFCLKLGCNGYPQFKLRLAQEISAGDDLYVDNMEREDSTVTVMKKIMDNILASVQAISKSTNPKSVDQAAKLIANCNTVYFFGMGASGPVALDAQHKFFRFGMSVVAHTDSINTRMVCSMLSPDDVAVFISYSGQTTALVEAAVIARESGTPIIGLTRNGTPLASHCDVVLNAVTAEDSDLFTPMTSRIIHLAIIDILATTVALKLGKRVEKRIESIQDNLRATRLDGGNDFAVARKKGF